jgi:serine/threonine protein phosphatase PrpC
MSVHAWAATDVGRKRKHNEDSFLVDPELGLYVVADGMGGHAAGEVASARCVEIVREHLLAHKATLDAFTADPGHDHREDVQKLLAKAIQKACKEIFQLAEKDDSKRGMGTTCVALVVCGKKAVVGHVGDSRAYLLRGGRAHQLTEDHSLVEEHVKRGLMTREQAEKSDIRNVITRAVGIQPSVEVDTLTTDLIPGDLLLLCSDGLHGYLEDAELPAVFGAEPRAQLPQKLVDLANARGGKDNVTALVVSAGTDDAGIEASEATDVDAKAEILRRIPLFQYMNYKELIAILAIAKGKTFAPGQAVVTEGDVADELYVLFRGKVEVRKDGSTIATLKAGGHFGEMGLVDQAPRSASVVAVETTSTVSLGRDALLKLMRKDSLLAVKLLWSFVQVMSERLRNTNEALSGLKHEVERLRGEDGNDLEIEELPKPPPLPFGDD